MHDRSFRRWLLVLALLGILLDQASKYVVFSWLHHHPNYYSSVENQGRFELIEGKFRLYTQYTNNPADGTLRSWSSSQLPHVNHGALFGLLNDHKLANYFFALVSVVAAIAIVLWSFRRQGSGDRLLCLALGLILGGTIGNLYDRLVFGGVRDFLYWSYLVEWPVFNFADCCLVVGAFALLAQAFLTNPEPKLAEAPADVATEQLMPSAAVAQVN